MLLQAKITADNPTAWLEQYAEAHPSSPNPTQMLVLVRRTEGTAEEHGTYDLHLVSYEPTRQQQRSRFYAKAEAAILWSPAVTTDKAAYKKLLKERAIDESHIAEAYGYNSAATMRNAQAYKRGAIFTRTLALANLFTSQPPSTL